MNPSIKRLYEMAQRESRVVLGLMSGTSLDGLDIALCEVKGSHFDTEIRLLHGETIPFTDAFRAEVRKVFAQSKVDMQLLCLLNPQIALVHAEMVNTTLKKWGVNATDVDLIGSHGQTVFHAPIRQHQLANYPNATLQIGDGDHLALQTGIITISDFRQKHIAAGGEGAPLAVYGDMFLFSSSEENRVLVNIGGISNFTILGKNQLVEEVFTTDAGPGNVLMDTFARHFYDLPYDKDGHIAASGKINANLLHDLKRHSFFEDTTSKTTGPELFNMDYLRNAQRRSGATSLTPEDLMATLLQFTVDTLADAIRMHVKEEEKYAVYVSGGGAKNSFLMASLQKQLPNYSVNTLDAMGYSAEFKEAMLFAVLANEAVMSNSTLERGILPRASFGKISFPN